jgi:hypothetical protein
VIFAENGTHESWPNGGGRITAGGDHGGKGPSWLPAQVEALGAFENFNQSNTPYLHYNGKVGTDGASIALHTSWCWSPIFTKNTDVPRNYSQSTAKFPLVPTSRFSDHPTPFAKLNVLPPLFGVWEVCRGPRWFITHPPATYSLPARQAGVGTAEQPYGGIDIALTFTPANWTLHLRSGMYAGANGGMNLDRPMTIVAWGGPVVLTQR